MKKLYSKNHKEEKYPCSFGPIRAMNSNIVKDAFKILFLLVALLVISANSSMAITNGTADGTYDFGNVGAVNSGGEGYKTQGDKFIISNNFQSAFSVIYLENQSNGSVEWKAEGGSTMKIFTFEDMAIGVYANSTTIIQFSVILRDASGGTIATHIFSGSKTISSGPDFLISSFFFSTPWPAGGYDNVAEIAINYTTSSPTSNFEFRTITLSNISNTVSLNAAPTAANFTAGTIYQGTAYAFATSNFSYSDGDADPLDNIKIETVPSNGTLWVDADGSNTINGAESALSNSSTISKTDLDAGRFKYLNTNGTSSNFTFKVNDGTEYSASTYTTTLTVTPEPIVSFTSASQSSTNESGSMTITAQLSGVAGNTVTIPFTVNGSSTATGSGTDYSISSSSLIISAGNTTASITITIATDALSEENETVIVDMGAPTNAKQGATTRHTATITDDDATPTIAFNAVSSNASEALSSADLQVDLSAVSGRTVTVDYTVTGTASSADYTLADGTLTIGAGALNKNITIASIVNDLLDEHNETVIVTLSNPTNASLGTNTVHTYTINDNDATPTIAFNAISSNASEALTSADIQVDLSAVSGLPVSVDYTVTGTANRSGTDYTLADGTLTIGAGALNKNITIASIVNDLLDENNETVIVTLSNPTNASLGTNTVHTYTINDNDATPTIAFNAVSSNASEALSSADLQVDLSAVSGRTVTVDYTVTGTASSADYTLADGTLTIGAGALNKNITIASIVNDLLDEHNETVIVTLSNPTNASLGTNTVHTYTINDNDATPTIAFNAISSNASEALSSADLQVDLSAVSGRTVTVDYTVTGTASIADYTLADGTLTIGAGALNKNITIASIVNDLLDENNETVILTLSNPTNASLGTNTVHTYTINDNDATPTIAFNAVSSNASEALSSADLQVDLSAASGRTVTVDYTVTGTASSADHTLADGTLTIAAGDQNDNITIAGIVNDLLDEHNETVILTLSNPTNASLGTNTVHTYTINDNDATPTVVFNAISSNASEAVSSADIQVDLSAVSGLPVSVDYMVTGTASSADYTLADGTLTISAGALNKNITIASIVNDLLDENNETVILTLSNPTNASLGTNTVHTYTINDNDATPTIAFNAVSSNASEALSSADLQVDLSAVSGLPVSVDYTVTGTASSADYTLADGTLTIGAGALNKNITIASIVNDLLDENNETVIVTLSNPTNASLGTNTVHSYTINDNDAIPTIAFNAVSSNASEALSSADLQVDLSAVSGREVTVDYTVTGTASSADYTLADGTLTISAGALNKNITIASIVNDLLDENNETVIVTLSNPTNASLGTNTVHMYTINDNDATPMIAFNAISSNASEALSSADLQVDLSAASGREVSVNYTVTGTATGGGTDYILADGTLTIDAGSVNKNITIASIVNDLLDENNETVILTLSNSTNASLGTNTVHTYTINDNDETPLITPNQLFTVLENSINRTSVGIISATDTDAGTVFSSWTIRSGNDDAIFTINSNTGEIVVDDNSNLDFETSGTYVLEISVSDGVNTSLVETVNIDIKDTNEVPSEIQLSNTTIAENLAIGTEVGILTTTDEDAAQTFTYTIVENENFEIVGDKLVSKVAFDFETEDTYSVEIAVTDQGGLTHKQSFDIQISDENEAPTAIQLSNITIAENAAIGSEVGELTASDEDADQTFMYSIADNENFEIVGDRLMSKSVLDYEAQNSYSVEITVSDQGGLTYKQSFSIEITDKNEVPSEIQLSNTTIAENLAIGSEVGILTATDEDAAQTFTYTIVENENFEIVGDRLMSKSVLDYEAQNSYSVEITVTDQGGLTHKQSFDIQISDENEAPTAISLSNTAITENLAIGTEIGILTATDEDAAQTFTYTITENENFEIAGDRLMSKSILDYEAQKSYSLEITVTDQGGLAHKQSFTIQIEDENEVPSEIQLSNTAIAENLAIGTEVGILTATDEDAAQTFTYTIVENENFEIVGDRLMSKSVFDYEAQNSYSVEITVSDQEGLTHKQSFDIQISDENEAPTAISLSNTAIAENLAIGTEVGILTSTDEDAAQTFTYTIAENVFFELTGDKLVSKSVFDYEAQNSYSVEITVTDQGGLTHKQSFDIQISDENEAPTAISLSNTTIAENLAIGTEVGILTVTDEDAAQTFTYTIVENENFEIVGDRLLSKAVFNFVSKNSYTVEITVKDQSNLSISKAFTIQILNTNESPTAIQLSNASIAENSSIGNEVGILTATDPDVNETFTFSLSENSYFVVNGDRIVSKELFDFEDHISYSLKVTVTDQGGLSFDERFTINIEDVNEAPEFISDASTSAVLGEMYSYTVEYLDQDADGCLLTAFEIPSWLTLVDNKDGTGTLSGIPAQGGSYQVILEASDSEFAVQQEFELVVETVTGIEDITIEPVVNIYPNPVVNELHIDLSNFEGQDLNIAFYALTGKLIFKESYQSIGDEVSVRKSLQDLGSGMYLLVLDMDGVRKTYKIVKE